MSKRAKSGTQRWRTQRLKKAKGDYWILVKNTPEGRVSVALGYIAEAQADTAVDRARQDDEETKDTPYEGRLIALARGGERDTLLHFLVFGERLADLLPEDFGPNAGKDGLLFVDYSKLTFADFADNVWAPVRKKEVAEGTWGREASRLKNLKAGMGHVKMRDLDAATWEKYANSRSNMAPRTVGLERALYREVLKHGVFLDACEMHLFRRMKNSTRRTRPITPFTKDEVALLLDAAASPGHRAMYAVGIGNGLRPGELRSVRWEDLDFERDTIRVRGTKNARADSVIPLTSLSRREAKQLWESLGKPTEGPAWVYKGRPIGDFKKSLQWAAERAGIDEGRRVHPNLLRHTFATIAATSGVPLPVAQQIMRHTSPTMLLSVYAKAGALAMREGLEHFPL